MCDRNGTLEQVAVHDIADLGRKIQEAEWADRHDHEHVAALQWSNVNADGDQGERFAILDLEGVCNIL
jgi:hypothetical protein